MIPVIAFDIAVVSQKVSVVIEDRCVSENVDASGPVVGRDGY